MTDPILWKENYLIGVKEIDEQHKYLFSLINEVLKCDKQDRLQLSLVQLYQYTREHFNDEEAFMRDLQYDNYKEHIKQHDLLISELTNKSSAALEDIKNRQELDHFLINWLVIHIMSEDMAIGDFYRGAFNCCD